MKKLIKVLRENGISISLDDENLKLKFEQKSIPAELVEKIRSNKPRLIQYLKENQLRREGAVAISPASVMENGYPLSSAQHRLWILSQFEDGLAAYNITQQVKLIGEYNINVFKQAIYAVVERHEILRTVFREDENGDVKQWVLSPEESGFEVGYLNLREKEDKETGMAAFIREDNFTSFDLSQGPLLRAFLIQLAEDDYTFHYNLHHIVGDGWSMNVLAREVIAIYEAMLADEEPKLPSLNIQYKDYTVWQQEQLGKPAFSHHREYYKELLSGDLPVIDFPFRKGRPAIKTQNGHTLLAYLPQEVSEQLKAFTKNQGGSLFTTLLSIWNALVYRYTGQEDIIIGSPVAGRDHRDLEKQIGLYVNTIVLRNKVQPRDSFSTHYTKIKKSVLAALDHGAYPFDQLLDDLDISRDVSRSMLFDILLVLQNSGDKLTAIIPQEDIEAVHDLGRSMTKFDMELNFWEVGNGIAFKVEYNTDVYEKSLVEGLIRHFQYLAETLANNPEQSLEEVDFLSATEREQLLCTFNDTARTFPQKGANVVDLFREQAACNPESTALKFEDKVISYQQLDQRSDVVANDLITHHGVQTNDLVGVCLYRSEWMLVAILGILKAGGAYVPVDPDYPTERMTYIAEDSGYKTCINEAYIQAIKASMKTEAIAVPKPEIAPAGYAYAIYTSGSTGTPKGVVNHHEGLLNRLLWMQEYLGAAEQDVYIQKTPYTFDVSVWELLLPLISGAKLIIAQPGGHKDPVYLQGIINAEEVTIIHFVPSMLKLFLESLDATDCPGLKHVVCSGEALPPNTILDFRTKLSSKIHNLYGPTEAAIDVTAIDLTNENIEENGVTIGCPVANTHIYIVNPSMALQPVGVAGELLIGGVQVSYGYLNKKELTDKHFIDSPFKKGERLYRTGDVARWNHDGTITYLSREDGQVKVHGNRVELGEIEFQLSLMPGINKAAVLFMEVAPAEKEIVVYIVGDVGQKTQTIRSYLANKVPAYAIPQYFVKMEDLPLSANGKIDKTALPDPLTHGLRTNKEHIPPSTKLESELAAMWEELLNVENISINESFFELGGNSIKAIRLLHKISKQYHIQIATSDFFARPTIQLMAEETGVIELLKQQQAKKVTKTLKI